MKKLLLFSILFFNSFLFSQINWTSLEQAVAAQTSNPKKIVIFFYSESSSACKKLETDTYNHLEISKILNDQYYPVKFNVEGNENFKFLNRTFSNSSAERNQKSNHDFANFMNVTTVPSTVFLDEKNNPITVLQGALTAKELEPYLQFIASDEYKKVENASKWETYRKKFKSKIKD